MREDSKLSKGEASTTTSTGTSSLGRRAMDWLGGFFAGGAPLARLHPLYEALDTFLYTPGKVTENPPHLRDALDMKRMMSVVVVALLPCMLMALYNTGLQANLALLSGGEALPGWRTELFLWLGLSFDPHDILSCFVHGALYYLPVVLVTLMVGGAWEALFAVVRKHEINEGFLVTWSLFPLICPPTVPLWQVVLGISFGVVIGKEIFGGTGMNFLNPALTARCFLFFAYPQAWSGDEVWSAVDGYTAATPLAAALSEGRAAAWQAAGVSWWDAFLGFVPGSMGETSALACLFGAFVLLLTGVGSWRTMLGVTVGTVFTVLLLNSLAGFVTNPMFSIPLHWHLVIGSWAFGTVFMATDPVSSPYTPKGRLIYGFAIGVLAILIRSVNPAFPEGMMLAILFMNTFAPVIDHFVVKQNVKRRQARNG